MSKPSIATQLASIAKQRELLAKKEALLKAQSHGKILSQIVQLAKGAGLSIEDIKAAFENKKSKTNASPKKPSKLNLRVKSHTTKGIKLPAKYKNPLNPEQTWTGRGVDPSWVAALREAGQLESALINPDSNSMI
jgi:DNA-binding protein H-NS